MSEENKGDELAAKMKADKFEVSGGSEERTADDDNFLKGEELAEKMRQDRTDGTINFGGADFKAAVENKISNINPFSLTGFEQSFTPQQREYDQGLLSDFGSGLYNSLIIGGGEGIANLAPTIAQAVGVESEFVDNWKTNVSSWFEAQETIYSDKANQPIEGFGDITSSHVAQALGQGVGFVAGIMGGASAIGNLGKLSKAEKGVEIATKIGSFLTGTTLMYPMIDKEAQAAGLSKANAARFALGVSGIVSLTEGAALEWIGKVATGGLSKGLTRKAITETLKNAAGKSPKQLQQLFIKNLGSTLKGKGAIIAESAAVEFGQEFSQTYIEEGAKQLYDNTYGKKVGGEGEFGADVSSYQTLVEATYGGIIGTVLGGGMGGMFMTKSGFSKDDSIDTSLAKESLFGYINNSIKAGNVENIDKVVASIDELVSKNEMSKEDGVAAKETVAELTRFAGDIKGANIDNGIANYQLFQLDKTIKTSQAVKESISASESANPTINKQNNEKKSKIELIEKRTQEHFDKIFESKKPETPKDKQKFEEKLAQYQSVTEEVYANNIDEEILNKKLDKIFDPAKEKAKAEQKAQNKVAKAEAKAKAESQATEEATSPKVYKDAKGNVFTQDAIDNQSDIKSKVTKAAKLKGEGDIEGRNAIMESIEADYGIDSKTATTIYQSDSDITIDNLTEVKPTIKPTESTVKPIEPKVETTIKKVKGYKTKGTFSSKVENAQRGKGDYIALDKPFKDNNSTDIEEVEVEYDEATNLDITTKDGMNKYSEIVSKLPQKFDSIEEMNEAKSKAIQDAGYTSLIGNIEQDNNESGRELVIYGEQKTESTKEQTEITEVKDKVEISENEYAELTNEQIDEQLNDEATSEVQAEALAKEKSKRNDATLKEKQNADLMARLKAKQAKWQDQRKSKDGRGYKSSRISNNIALYEKIKAHFKKIFPNVSVTEIDRISADFGATTLARLVDGGIQIDKNSAIQTSLIHEYAHVYIKVLGINSPLVKLGKKQVEGTQFDLDAIKNYPDLSRTDQLEEALAEALATNSLEKLESKFEGSGFVKFKEFAKRFWKKIKSFFTKSKSKDIVEILSEGMTMSTKPFSIGVNGLAGMNKDQRKQNIDPRFSKTVDIVSGDLILERLKNIEGKELSFDTRNQTDVNSVAFNSLFDRYMHEQSSSIADSDTKIFQDVDLGMPKLEDITDVLGTLLDFSKKVKSEFPDIYRYINNVTQSMIKTNIDLDFEEDIKDDNVSDVENGLTEKDQDSNNNQIKATKKVNTSIRSILSTIVDESGHKIETDKIFEYIGKVSKNTWRKKGFLDKLKNDAADNVIAQRIQDIVGLLSQGQANGFLKTITSLEQVVSEISTYKAELDDEGRVKHQTLLNFISNRRTSQAERNIKDWRESIDMKKDFLASQKGLLNALTTAENNVEYWSKNDSDVNPTDKLAPSVLKPLNEFVDQMNILFDANLTVDSLMELIDKKGGTEKYSAASTFYNNLFGQYESLSSYWDGKYEYGNISGFMRSINELINEDIQLKNTYLNGSNNTVTTTQLGHWVSELNSILKNTNRIGEMLSSKVFKNNPALEFFKENGLSYMVPGSMKNILTNENFEHSKMSANDHHVEQFHKFATVATDKYYSQSLGVLSNRDNKLFFKVKKHTNSELREAYKGQAETLQYQVNQHIKGMNPAQIEAVKNDFNKLYIHDAKVSGNKIVVESGYNSSTNAQAIKDLKSFIDGSGLIDDYYANEKAGNKNSTDLVSNYFYNEALNRIALGDVYGGPAIYHSKPKQDGTFKKGGVESSIKRNSGINSTGENIELSNDVIFVFFNAPDGGSDSFSINGPGLSADIKEYMGAFDKMGVNSKNNIYQIDPTTGKQLYIKTSSLNVEMGVDENNNATSNLDGFGDGYKNMAHLLAKLEKDSGKHVMLLDSSSNKGTFSDYKAMSIDELYSLDSATILKNATNPITIENLRTPFNLNKDLGDLSGQNAIFSTQANNIQYALGADISVFEATALNYLKNKYKGAVESVQDFNNVINEMLDDLNDRDKSATTEILEGIRNWNSNTNNEGNYIDSFDHSSLKLIYEQFVSSRLSKRGIKIDMAGNFMHQLPDTNIGNEVNEDTPINKRPLAYREVAVSYKMFANTMEEANALLENAKLRGEKLEVVAVRIPASSPVSMFAGEVKYFLDTTSNTVVLSKDFVNISDSDHDGDKAMIYRKEMDDKGNFVEDGDKTQMFNEFYKNLNDEAFVKNAEAGSLNFEKLLSDALKSMGISEVDYKSAIIDDVVDITDKLNLGASATGRFAIAGKLMSVLSAGKVTLNDENEIEFDGQTLKEFSTKSMDDIALFLQAALDMGNNPILASTGFNNVTIDVGNAMLLLGLNKEQVMKFLTSKPIIELTNKYKNSQLAFGTTKSQSVKEFIKQEFYEYNTETKQNELKKDVNKDIVKFLEFNDIADGLSKLIPFVQLDKKLPNNARATDGLVESIEDFHKLPFNVDKVMKRDLMKWRENVLTNQAETYNKQQLLQQPVIKSIVKKIGASVTNKFSFEKIVDEQLIQLFSQAQISNQVKNATESIIAFSNKMKTLHDVVKLKNKNIRFQNPVINSHIEKFNTGIYTEAQLKEKIGDDNFADYKSQLEVINRGEMFDGNTLFDYLTFNDNVNKEGVKDGSFIVSLDGRFKATQETKEQLYSDIQKIKELNPDLYRELIDYQLLRYGVNNKIGSFIDALPMSISMKLLTDTTKLKNSPIILGNIESRIADNIASKNVNSIKDAGKVINNKNGIITLETPKQVAYVNFNGDVYKKYSQNGVRFEIIKSTFESNEYFTRYDITPIKDTATREEIENILNNC